MGLGNLFGGESVLEIDEGNDVGLNISRLGLGFTIIFSWFEFAFLGTIGWLTLVIFVIGFIITFYGLEMSTKHQEKMEIKNKKRNEERARKKEDELDYKGALKIWKALENKKETKRLRQKIKEEKQVKVDQTIVQGDQVTKTEIKDSVVSKSNIGSGGDDKVAKLEKIVNMKEKGLIDADELKQMKKEILGE